MQKPSSFYQKVWPDFNIFLMGDSHEGAFTRHESGWNEFVAMVQSPYADLRPSRNLIVEHGDMAECSYVGHPHYTSLDSPRDIPMEQYAQCVEQRLPIRKHIVTSLDGNHDLRLKNIGLFVKSVCKALGCGYGTFSTKVAWHDKFGLIFKSFHTHGRKSISSAADDPGRQISNMELSLKRHLVNKASDCVLMAKGHTHRLLVRPPKPQLGIADNGVKFRNTYSTDNVDYTATFIPPDVRWYVNTGSFFRLYGSGECETYSYAELGEYDPMELGFAIALVRDRRIVEIRRHIL